MKKKISIKEDISEKIYSFKTKYPEGLIGSEIKKALIDYPGINMDKFNDAMIGNTCKMIDGEFVMYHTDIIHAISCGAENRELDEEEWD